MLYAKRILKGTIYFIGSLVAVFAFLLAIVYLGKLFPILKTFGIICAWVLFIVLSACTIWQFGELKENRDVQKPEAIKCHFETTLTPGWGNVTSISIGRPHRYIPMAHDGKQITALICVHCHDLLTVEKGDAEEIRKILDEVNKVRR